MRKSLGKTKKFHWNIFENKWQFEVVFPNFYLILWLFNLMLPDFFTWISQWFSFVACPFEKNNFSTLFSATQYVWCVLSHVECSQPSLLVFKPDECLASDLCPPNERLLFLMKNFLWISFELVYCNHKIIISIIDSRPTKLRCIEIAEFTIDLKAHFQPREITHHCLSLDKIPSNICKNYFGGCLYILSIFLLYYLSSVSFEKNRPELFTELLCRALKDDSWRHRRY